MATGLRKKLSTVREQVKEAYLNGAVLREIADLHGVSIGTVRNMLTEMGVVLRPRGRRHNQKERPKVLAVQPATGEVVTVSDTYEGGAF